MTVSTRVFTFLLACASLLSAYAGDGSTTAKKILFIGDSTTAWLADRLNAYGKVNGFTVAAEVWDGSTIRKWADWQPLSKVIAAKHPDVIFVSLGLNDMYEKNPEKRLGPSLAKLLKVFGNIPVIWIGPVSWPGKNLGNRVSAWLSARMGAGHYFDSSGLTLSRQAKTNPHPTRDASVKWMDSILDWLNTSGAVKLPGYTKPAAKASMVRPKAFHYRRMSRK